MTNADLAPTVRLTIIGEAGPLDLVVPRWTQVARLTEAYTHRNGLSGAYVLRGSDGRLVEGREEVARLDLTDGAVMVMTRRYGSVAGPRGRIEQRLREALRSRLPALALLTALVAAGVVGIAGDASYGVRLAVTVVLGLGALLVLLPAEPPVEGGRLSRLRRRMLEIRDVAPGFGVAAAATGLGLGARTGVVSTLVVAALAGAVVAAVGLALTRDGHDEFLRVWLIATATGFVLALVVAFTSGSPVALSALTLGAATLMARVLPTLVVDVPDRVLLDTDRLAVTAWAARERPAARRRTTIVRTADIEALVARGQQLLLAGTVAVGAAAVASAGHLLLAPVDGARRVGVLVAVLLASFGLALVARSVRASVPRAVLRASAALLFVGAAASFVATAGPATSGLVVLGSVVLGLAVVMTAVALGQGWRSVRWARLADVAETFSLVVGVALVPLTCGLFDAARLWAS